jgi:predicted RNase H-like nuclease (RuvC/YqgF family)
MTPGQRAAIVASARDWERAQLVGRPKKAPPKPAPGSTFPADTVKLRAQQADASVATQRRADAVAKAAPELAREVAQGKTTLGQAVRQVAPQLAQRPPEPAPPPPAPAPVPVPVQPKSEPAGVEALRARIAELEAENADLRGELNEARDAAADLAEQLESYDKATAGEVAAAKELTRLKQQIRVTESQRDQHMTTCNELRRQVKMLQRQLAKMERSA